METMSLKIADGLATPKTAATGAPQSKIVSSFAEEGGHFYFPNGTPAYRIVGKNGRERNTTLRDARELGLYPSVSAILKLEAAPGLENWKVNQALLSAMTLPRVDGEDADSFMRRCLDDSRVQSRKAAERGTYLHGLLEQTVRQGGFIGAGIPSDDFKIINPCMVWIETNFTGYQWHPERSFACGSGFGGKIDLCGERGEETVVIDYKFKADIVQGKRLAYDNHSTQLGAYAYGLGKPRARCINLFVSSTVPGLIVPIEWSQAEINCGWQVFSHLLDIWKLRRGL